MHGTSLGDSNLTQDIQINAHLIAPAAVVKVVPYNKVTLPYVISSISDWKHPSNKVSYPMTCSLTSLYIHHLALGKSESLNSRNVLKCWVEWLMLLCFLTRAMML